MKRRRAALSSSGEMPDLFSPVAEPPETAYIRGRVAWKTPVATAVSCLLMRDRGMGSWERRCWTRFSAMMMLISFKAGDGEC